MIIIKPLKYREHPSLLRPYYEEGHFHLKYPLTLTLLRGLNK